jgi:hypothetical protein
MKYVSILLLALVLGCVPSPAPVAPGPDADAASSIDDSGADAPATPDAPPAPAPIPSDTPPAVLAGCANLRAIGCAEGASPTCEALNTKILADRLTALGPKGEAPMACVGAAKSGAAVRACAPTWKSACAGH